MKLAQILKEIGDTRGVKVYDWVRTTNETDYKDYTFETESGLIYRVEVELERSLGSDKLDKARVAFGLVDDTDDMFVDYGSVPTKGELYKVMATITECLKDFISKNKEVKTLVFWVDKEGPELSKRANLYAKYVSQQLPNARMRRLSGSEDEQERIVIDLK